jgi:hypothetical protein
VRPSGASLVGVDGTLPRTFKSSLTDLNDGKVDNLEYKVRTQGLSLFFHRYFWPTSAFYWGLGVRREDSKISFDERKTGHTNDDTDRVRVEYTESTTWVGLPLGWDWVWENGFTLMLDFGPRVRVANSRTFSEDGGQDVDTGDRDSHVDSIGHSTITLGFGGLIGYSF